MNTRKRTRQATRKEQNTAVNMSKPKKLARLDTEDADERKIDSSTETMNTPDEEAAAASINSTDDNSVGLNTGSNPSENFAFPTDESLNAVGDELLREADILMASIAAFRRENNSEENEVNRTNDNEAVIVTETTDAAHQTPANIESPEAASTSQASAIANVSQTNPIDDSVVLIDDLTTEPVRPIVRDDDDVIFVTESRQRQRTIATIDLCDTPDNSFSCTKNVRSNPKASSTVMSSDSPDKSSGSRIAKAKCPICLDMYSMDEIMSTMCGHLYCEPCIRNVIKTRKKCPMCNRGLKANQVHRIFLDT